MRSLVRAAAASLVVTVLLVAPVAVAADTTGGGGSSTGFGTMSITIGRTATLQARLVVNVPVTVTCTSPADAISVDGTFAALQVQQASGKGVAQATGFGQQLTCDGLPHTFTMSAAATGLVFHGGSAVAMVDAITCGTLSDFTFACTSVITPWTTIRIAG